MVVSVIVLIALTACLPTKSKPHIDPPPPVPKYTIFAHICNGEPCAPGQEDFKLPGAVVTVDADGQSLLDTSDSSGNAIFLNLTAGERIVCASAAGFVKTCQAMKPENGQDVFLVLVPDVPPLLPIRSDGRIFRTTDGKAWRFEEVTAFGIINRYAKGEDISDFLTAYKGYKVLRVWPYVPRKDWGADAWDVSDSATISRFISEMGAKGWRVELTLLTDDDPARLTWAKTLVPQLTSGGCPANLMLEAGNEPTTHKSINTAALRDTLAASGCPYTSGDYEDVSRWYGTYATVHTKRSSDWPRFSHDLMEFFSGTGPDHAWAGSHQPVVAGEPAKPGDVAMTDRDVLAYFGGVSLFGAGGTWHCADCRFGRPGSAEDVRLGQVALRAMEAFPADAPNGPYRRIVENGQSNDARTYVIGGFMVRSQQGGNAAPESGWTAIDELGVLWSR